MSEIEQLKKMIDSRTTSGVKTTHVREDYEPIGDLMIRDLCATGEYVTRKVPPGAWEQEWKIFKKEFDPY
jgi:hypothetical protein